ncbi:tumor necrosis factor receptor superfamily member 11B-like isoform X2 [Bacillus rossius redtenbacheri]|uniref:tumor necrosis factor receptor superfamily member 11B-like isoform X2 n=1 Tax=Bacillus rossius redtenbacheri TaxID=93214 RepID=UPI002FDE9D43
MRPSRCLLITLASLLLVQTRAWPPRLRHRHGDPRCSACPPGAGVSSPCSPLRDTLCSTCPQGLAYSPHHSARAACALCSRCGPGLFEAHPCTPRSDTVCDDCSNPRPPPAANGDYSAKCRLS